MKKVYIARRIPKQPQPELILNLTKDLDPEEVVKRYIEKTQNYESFIYNGPWILRPPISEDLFSLNKMPHGLNPEHVWKMVKEKIESSNVFIGIINNLAYGTIAETGYACRCPNLAVYVIPEIGIKSEELQDLWFIFQMAKATQSLWCDEDIGLIKEFFALGIDSVQAYKSYVAEIIPNFMKK